MAVPPVNVLVLFSSEPGEAESLALAAGVGALQARAEIRLRRFGDGTSEVDAAGEHAARMALDYIEPRPADLAWADIVVVVAPQGSAGGLDTYLAALPAAGSVDKILLPLAPDRSPGTIAALSTAGMSAGFTLKLPPSGLGDVREAANRLTRELTAAVRATRAPLPPSS
jgi:hypothetical protein